MRTAELHHDVIIHSYRVFWVKACFFAENVDVEELLERLCRCLVLQVSDEFESS